MTHVLERVSAKGFRSLADVDVEFGPFSVLVGANGSGKSNLLKVLSFVRDTARDDVQTALNVAGGWHSVLRQDGETDAVELLIEGQVTQFASRQAPDRYCLTLRWDEDQIHRSEEFLFKRTSGRGRRLSLRSSGREVEIEATKRNTSSVHLASDQVTALGALSRLEDARVGQGPLEFFSFLSSIRYLDPEVARAREGVRMKETKLADDASNLAVSLRSLRDQAPESFDSLQTDMRRCLPGLERIVFEERGGATTFVVAQLKEQGLSRPIDLADASFGTVRLLALLVALHEPNPPKVTVIEEVDHGLHPYALDVLVDRMREASQRTQIIVASHSPTLVNRLNADEIIICDRHFETGESIIPAKDRDELADLLQRAEEKNWRAGELWFAGALGGVPE